MENNTTTFDFITFNETVLAECDTHGLNFDSIPQEDWDWLYDAAEDNALVDSVVDAIES